MSYSYKPEYSPRNSHPYGHLLQVPLSSVWEFSDETYRGWTEELLEYERDWIMSQMRGEPSKSGGETERDVNRPVKREDGDDATVNGSSQNVQDVTECIEGLEIDEDQNTGNSPRDQAAQTGCIGCSEANPEGAGLWELHCGHAFHPNCLRHYLQTCWQTCQHQDQNPTFVCPHCGDQLDAMWCKALIGTVPMEAS